MEPILGLNPIFFFQALMGLSFVLLGFLLGKYPPKKINHIYGYRTKGSMKSQERWDYAQVYSSAEMVKHGLIMGLLGLILGVTTDLDGISSVVIFLALLTLSCVALVVRTEQSLKKKFP